MTTLLAAAMQTPLPSGGKNSPTGSILTDNDNVITWDDDTVNFIPIPAFGGIMMMPGGGKDSKIKDEVFAWSGTDPDIDVMTFSWDQKTSTWTFPKEKYLEGVARIQGPTRNNMYRPRGVKNERQTTELCIGYDGTKFNGLTPKDGKITVPLKTYKDMIRHHCIETGMWDVFNLQDPKKTDVNWDLFRYHSILPMTHVTKEVKRLKGLNDIYINQNLKWSGEYIRASITTDLLEKVLQDVAISASGPETFVSLMRVVHSDSYEALELTKSKLENLRLKNYPGENVRKCNEDVSVLSEQLVSGGHFNNELLCKIAQIYEGALDTKFSQWATSNLYDPCVNQVRELRVLDKSAIDEPLWTPEMLIRMSNLKYDDMIASGRYTSATKTADAEGATIHGYMTAIRDVVKTELEQVSFGQRSGQGTSHKTSTGGDDNKCHKCQQPGHKAADCTADANATVTINGTVHPMRDNKWKTIAPTDGITKFKLGRHVWRYCTTCSRWQFHDADHHDKWVAKRASSNTAASDTTSDTSSISTPPAAAANFAASALSDDDFISFGGLHCVR